jgi:hypothetical protein
VIARTERDELALRADGAGAVAERAVELDQPAARRLVTRIGRALALEEGDLLGAPRAPAGRSRSRASTSSGAIRANTRQCSTARSPCPSES